jgi:ParB-like chromosome segregation protein Spo0J
MRIDRVEIEKLVEHPGNANRMDEKTFAKLCGHIERTGRYEPIVVRPAPGRDGFFQILNGHHRAKALGKLGFLHADCVIWDVDEAGAELLLATLNRLCGRDIPALRAKLIGSLADSFGKDNLKTMLACSAERIDSILASLAGNVKKPAPFLEPMTFFLCPDDKRFVEQALDAAAGQESNLAKRRNIGLMHIARFYIGKEMFEK